MLRAHQLPIDYQHIKVYGKIQGYSDSWVKGQQWVAHRMDAPHDTVSVVDGTPCLFRNLSITQKREFRG